MSAFLSVVSIFLWHAMYCEAQVIDTSSKNEYIMSTMTCTEPSCQIICDTEFGCSGTTIIADLSSTLTISCLANNSCSNMNVTSGGQTSTSINCEYLQSCTNAVFTVANSPNVNLKCNYDSTTDSDDGACDHVTLYADTSTNVEVTCIGDYNCNNLDIYTKNVVNALSLTCDGYYQCVWAQIYCPLENQCNITCSSDSFSCSFMDIYIENVNSDINIQCPGVSQYECSSTEIHCGDTSTVSELYYDGKSSFGCHMDGCCPPSFYGPTTTCTAQQKCIVDCITTDCSKYTIDGTAASSLVVNCSETGGCGVANILCPTNANAPCTVDCQGNKACYQSFVKAKDSYSLQVECDGTESCKTMDINCPSDTDNNNGGCDVNCNGQNSCSDATIKATGSYSLDLDCVGNRACYGLQPIYCPYNRKDACNIDCSSNDDYICYGMIFYVDDEFVTDYIDLKCPATDGANACDNQLFVCIADGSTQKQSAWMTFDSTESVYRCDVDPDDLESNNCCPWIGIPAADNPTDDPTTGHPSKATINPTLVPSVSPTRITDNPTTYAPTTNHIDDVVNSSIYSTVSVVIHIFVFVFCLFAV